MFPQTDHTQNQSHKLSLHIFSKFHLSVSIHTSYLVPRTQHLHHAFHLLVQPHGFIQPVVLQS